MAKAKRKLWGIYATFMDNMLYAVTDSDEFVMEFLRQRNEKLFRLKRLKFDTAKDAEEFLNIFSDWVLLSVTFNNYTPNETRMVVTKMEEGWFYDYLDGYTEMLYARSYDAAIATLLSATMCDIISRKYMDIMMKACGVLNIKAFYSTVWNCSELNPNMVREWKNSEDNIEDLFWIFNDDLMMTEANKYLMIDEVSVFLRCYPFTFFSEKRIREVYDYMMYICDDPYQFTSLKEEFENILNTDERVSEFRDTLFLGNS